MNKIALFIFAGCFFIFIEASAQTLHHADCRLSVSETLFSNKRYAARRVALQKKGYTLVFLEHESVKKSLVLARLGKSNLHVLIESSSCDQPSCRGFCSHARLWEGIPEEIPACNIMGEGFATKLQEEFMSNDDGMDSP